MGWEAGLIILVIAVVAFAIVGNQLMALLQDTIQTTKDKINQNDNKIPTPKAGTKVCDLTITFKPKILASAFGSGNILYLNDNGGTISYNWYNCHTKKSNLLSFLNWLPALDWIDTKLHQNTPPTDELGIPIVNLWEEKFTVNFKLVNNNGNTKSVPQHQDLQFKVGAGIKAGQIVTYEIKYFELAKESYTLEMIIQSGHYRFADHEFGEPYKQIINAPR